MKTLFVPNNLNFRMYAAKAREKYCNSQAFALGQLLTSTTHKFSTTATELLLLKYDMWLRWLLDAEELIRTEVTKESGITMSLLDELVYGCNKVNRCYIDIAKENPSSFDPGYVDLWVKSHHILYELLIHKITSSKATTNIELITEISNTLITIMNATLYEIHEIDNLVNTVGTRVFLSASDACFEFSAEFPDRCMLAERLAVYQYGFGEIKEVCIKDYTSDDKDVGIIVDNLKRFGYKVIKVI